MGASKDIFLRMREEEYADIPKEIKEKYLNSKNVTKATHDWEENMQDELYNKLYNEKKKVQKELEEREYYLREKRRKNNK